jgi:PAS domain S-box-containing protein
MRVKVLPIAPAPPKPGPSGAADAERWLAAIVESSDDAIISETLDGIITSWNDGATRLFGYEPGEAIGRYISFLAWPGEEGQLESFLEQLRRGERVEHFEVARRHKSGRRIIVSISLSPVMDSSGKIIGIAKIARDTTDREARVERLAVEVLRLRDLAEAEVLRLRDLDEIDVLRLRNLDEAEVLRLRDLAEAEVLRLRDLDEIDVLRLRNLDEAEVLRLRDLAEAEVLRLRDLAEKKAASAIALIAERKFRELIESAPDAILQMNPSGAIVIANRRATEMFGYSHQQLLNLGVNALVPDSMRGDNAAHLSYFAAAGNSRSVRGLDLYAQRKDGTQFPVEVSLSHARTDNDADVTAIIRDVTERKQSEQRERVLRESYMSELEMRSKDAESAVMVKSDFIAHVSHELRTPLHTIIGFSELLAEDSSGPLNEKQQKFLHHIRKDSEHLMGMINDVLDLSRIEAGRLTVRTKLLPLKSAVTEAVDALRPFANSRSVSLREGHDLDLTVCADPLRLRQVLYNLLNNGTKFTGAGGHVSVDACLKGNLVEVTVSDTGIGIAPGDRPHIFEKFYQASDKPGGAREGTGLGLAICRQLVEMQGGTIWVESELHKGSRFHFTLPIV